ncbi:MAG: IclR family transcriptional regulator [Pseudooceanicola sp.]
MTYQQSSALAGAPALPQRNFRSELPGEVVKSAARTIQILEFFDHVRRDVSITEIAHALNYPQSSTSALLRSMVAMGYLQHNRAARTYRLTRRTGLLGAWVDPSLVRQGSIVSFAHGIARHTDETVVLARMNEMRVQVIYVAEGAEQADISVGCHYDMAHSAAGAALLSMLDEKQARRVIVRLNAEMQDGARRIDTAAKLAEIAHGRREAAFTGEGFTPGHAAVAAQVRHESAGDMLVLAVEGARDRITPRIPAISGLIRAGLANLSA